MCRIRRLTGRIAARPANVLNHYAGEIFLNQATFEAGWEHGQLPTFDAATVTGDGRDGIPEIVLDDMTFASATQAESLPAFDPKTLTGSDPVRMLSVRKTSLTPSEVRLLQKGLAERELTIDRGEVSGLTRRPTSSVGNAC